MMEFVLRVSMFLPLFVILYLMYTTLVLRERIILYLKEHYKEEYERLQLNYTWKQILTGDQEIIKNQLRQNKKLINNDICFDEYIKCLQRKYKRNIFYSGF